MAKETLYYYYWAIYVHNFVRTLTKLVTYGTKKDHLQLHHTGLCSPFSTTQKENRKSMLGRSFLEETVQHQIPSLTHPGKRLVLFCKINNKAILFNRVL